MKNGHALKIDRGIPVPAGNRQNKGYSAVIRQLRKGDSVLLPEVKIQTAVQLCYQISNDKTMFTRRSEEGGVRVWRLK
jgi:hypothetical protein